MALLDGAVDKAQADVQVDLEQAGPILRDAIVQAGAMLLGVLDHYTIQINFVKKS